MHELWLNIPYKIGSLQLRNYKLSDIKISYDDISPYYYQNIQQKMILPR